MHILLTAMPESPGTFWEQFTGYARPLWRTRAYSWRMPCGR